MHLLFNSNKEMLLTLTSYTNCKKSTAIIITSSSNEVRTADIFKILQWEPIDNILYRRQQVMIFIHCKKCSQNTFNI